MDDNAKAPSVEDSVAGIEQRLEAHREHVSETLEALAYKTDVRARGSEALSDGIETARQATAQATQNAAVQAVDLTARASEAVSAGLEIAKQSTSDALETVRARADEVEPETRNRLVWGITAGAGALLALVLILGRRRSDARSGDTVNDVEIRGVELLDDESIE